MTIPDVVTNDGISYKVTGIGDNAFNGCTGLTSVEIPNSVTSIGEYAFYECTSLTSLTIGNSVTSMGSCAFAKCTGLKSVEIPNSVTSIGLCAFDGCTGLKSVEIPNSVTSIGDAAFTGCTGLNSLTIGNSVKSIGYAAFAGCEGLTSLTIPNSVTSIGDFAFSQCAGLTSLTIGSNVDTIEVAAFAGCRGLSMMMVKASTPPTLAASNVFDGVTTSIQIYVPYGSIDKYKEAPGWNEFTNYQPIITGYGQNTDSDHWVFIASPLATSVLPTAVDGLVADPVENYDLYRFNQSGKKGEWQNYKNPDHTEGFVLENGKGYLYANMNDVTLTFVGDMNMKASEVVGLVYDGTANLPGWNLVGNPFTEAAYIDRPYYKMNDTGTDVTPVETYENTPVAAYSGIMVHAKGSDESVTFTKSGSKSSDNGGLQITLSKAGVRGDEAQDKVIVSFNKYAQLSKFIFNEDNAKLYIPMGGEDYAIAYSDRQSNMPLYFKTKEMGIYTMSFEGAIDNIKIIDNLDGSVIDLNAEKSFTFVGTPSDRNDRFTIVFNTPATEDFAYQSGDGIVVNGEGELQVFDIMGRMVAKYHVNGVETVNIPCQSGVYVLRLLGKETNTQKIVVK
ncbi:MAG: leucine-rich repeat domain-containing protein [Bacteroidales bacterium]|nr:leucine-rich repeat domain-containing protein [Bacteroidales bacterium]